MQDRMKRRQLGQTIIEFALLAPLMFLFVYMIVDFGRAMGERIMIEHAVREGARYAAVHTSCDDIMTRTYSQAQKIINKNNNVKVTYSNDPAEAGDTVTVSIVNFNYTPAIINSISKLTGGTAPSIPLTSSASARLEMEVKPAGGCP